MWQRARSQRDVLPQRSSSAQQRQRVESAVCTYSVTLSPFPLAVTTRREDGDA